RTRQLAGNVDSLRRRLDENAARHNGNSTGQQQGQQEGSQQGQQGQQSQQGQQGQQGQEGQQGQQGQQGSSQNGARSGDPRGGGRQAGGSNQWGRNGGYWGDDRQLSSELRERLRDAQNLRRDWGSTNGSVGQLDEVIDQLRRLAD